MPESLTDEFRGTTPPGRDDEWDVQVLTKRTVVQGDPEECVVTGAHIPPGESHLLVILRHPGRDQPDVETVVVRDEDALGRWMRGA